MRVGWTTEKQNTAGKCYEHLPAANLADWSKQLTGWHPLYHISRGSSKESDGHLCLRGGNDRFCFGRCSPRAGRSCALLTF